jgi:predicted Zn-dependent protease
MSQALILATLIAAATVQTPPPTGLDLVFSRLYSYNFAGALATLDEEARERPLDPLVRSVRGVAYLFSEFDRQKILEMQFFEDDNEVTDRTRVKSDPAVRERLFATTAEARKLAVARLAVDPNDQTALFAMCMATGVETDYYGFIEKRYFKTYSTSKEGQKYAHQLLAFNPPVYDAYLTLGTVEYVVSNLNFFFRLFVRFDQIQGSKQKAVENLDQVIKYGHYYRPFAKILLAAVYLRDKRFAEALALLKEVGGEFPGNTLIQKEIARAAQQAALPVTKRR